MEKDEEQRPAQMDGEKDINKRTEEKEKRMMSAGRRAAVFEPLPELQESL